MLNSSNKYIAILFLMFAISSKATFASDCNIERFKILKEIIPLAKEVTINDYTIQKKEILSRISDIEEQIKLIPISITANISNSQNFEGLEKNNQVSKQRNSIDFSYELNRIKIINTKKQRLLEKELLEFELLKLELKETETIYEGLLEYLMGLELQNYFDIEKRYYEIKRDYINERKKFGDLNLENLLKVEKEIRNISDKILANSVKQIERLDFLNITKDFVPSGLKISNNELNILSKDCFFEPIFSQGMRIEEELLSQKVDATSISNSSQLNFSLQISDETSSNQYQNNLGASIQLKVPLYDGGILDTKKRKIFSEKRILESKRRIEQLSFDTTVSSRISTERVFYESFNTIEREITALRTASSELKTRQNLGQGVFEERINNNLQILNLKQAKLRLVTDFLSGWIKFLGTVQDGYW